MTEPNRDMPENPGDPDATDTEGTTPEAAEAEAAAAEEAQAEADLEAEVNEALADVDLDSDDTVTDAEAELAERTEDLLRVTAEYANYRRRTERDRTTTIATTKANVLEKFIAILDDLELAEQHGDLAEGPLKAFADKFRNTITGLGLEAYGEEGDAFDPERHEAVQDLSEGDEKVIGTVLRKGYSVGDRLVRNAMVIIADPANPEAQSAE
ncbi:nucleotide exchange factor GrpE [Corynebacterium epidermidicanis]|uniref:Protein GrpE n=1 Tax=Corynebacterium epidermidicanis TaxID=1050174 RepID=A0A0G3GZ13_9CORY|nr:nucleotide exchange factor GrpE [Corynebacterium epidermidicanis]AKK04092.1 molecular chaperone GrpE (heat shock protein) [Corynebacterium epidermidicanis]